LYSLNFSVKKYRLKREVHQNVCQTYKNSELYFIRELSYGGFILPVEYIGKDKYDVHSLPVRDFAGKFI